MNNKVENTIKINKLAKSWGVNIIGISDLEIFKNDLRNEINSFIFNTYKYAIVLGAEYGNISTKATGDETSLFLEEVAFKMMMQITEKEHYHSLIIHTEDEFDPRNRMGLLPLKALAKGAGIGWQGRSLLIVSPDFGPLHRLIAILTDMPLDVNDYIENNCKDCTLCIEKCPPNALKFNNFNDHPEKRDDVLDFEKCNGDNGCKICIMVCPWFKQNTVNLN